MSGTIKKEVIMEITAAFTEMKDMVSDILDQTMNLSEEIDEISITWEYIGGGPFNSSQGAILPNLVIKFRVPTIVQ